MSPLHGLDALPRHLRQHPIRLPNPDLSDDCIAELELQKAREPFRLSRILLKLSNKVKVVITRYY